MKLSEIMTREVEIIQPDDTLRLAAQKMRDRDIGFLPVCDGDSLMGVLSDRDITIRAFADGMELSLRGSQHRYPCPCPMAPNVGKPYPGATSRRLSSSNSIASRPRRACSRFCRAGSMLPRKADWIQATRTTRKRSVAQSMS